MKDMCDRFVAVLDTSGLSDRKVSEILGYAGQSTISGVRRAKTFVDAERLAAFGGLLIRGAACPNLHWILTGTGEPFLLGAAAPNVVAALGTTAKLGRTVIATSRPHIGSKKLGMKMRRSDPSLRRAPKRK